MAVRSENKKATNAITIMSDKDVPYHVLRKVMYTLSANGWENVTLAVLRNT